MKALRAVLIAFVGALVGIVVATAGENLAYVTTTLDSVDGTVCQVYRVGATEIDVCKDGAP